MHSCGAKTKKQKARDKKKEVGKRKSNNPT